jgi:NAD+ synthase
MDRIDARLTIDPEATTGEIVAFLQRQWSVLGKDGAILGLSGGMDSAIAAYLSARAMGRENVRLLNLPERDSKRVHRQHAQLIADKLGIQLEIRDITPILDEIGVYKLMPGGSVAGRRVKSLAVKFGKTLQGLDAKSILKARLRPEPDSLTARGNAYAMAKHRVRMLLLYQEADVSNLMVVGAANKTEFMTGTFSQWGCDRCADVMPLLHLYRSQLHPLAEFLGVPEVIVEKAADPDVMPGVDDKAELLGSFDVADRILIGLEEKLSREELCQQFGKEIVDRIAKLVTLSEPMRESPYMVK